MQDCGLSFWPRVFLDASVSEKSKDVRGLCSFPLHGVENTYRGITVALHICTVCVCLLIRQVARFQLNCNILSEIHYFRFSAHSFIVIYSDENDIQMSYLCSVIVIV